MTDLDAAAKAAIDRWLMAINPRTTYEAKDLPFLLQCVKVALRAQRRQALGECLNLNYEQRKALFDASQQACEEAAT